MIIGHLSEKISEYFGNGEKFGVNIDYIIEDKPLGTAGAFYYLKDKLIDGYFLLVFGDIFFNIDIDKMENFHRSKKRMLQYLLIPILTLMTPTLLKPIPPINLSNVKTGSGRSKQSERNSGKYPCFELQ